MEFQNNHPLNLPCPSCGDLIAMPTQWVNGMRMNCPACEEEITKDIVATLQKEVYEDLVKSALKKRPGRF